MTYANFNTCLYANFSKCHFLKKFNSNQRRNIKRERESIKKFGVKVEPLCGSQINVMNLKKMHYFYELHCSRWGIWGSKYLTESFFNELTSTELKENIVLFDAKEEGIDKTIGMSLCVKNEKMLWGRYWGSEKNIDCLHFEACYYTPIEWAIKNKIKYFLSFGFTKNETPTIVNKIKNAMFILHCSALGYIPYINLLIQTFI